MTNHPHRSKQQQAQHTPGPWTATKCRTLIHITGADGAGITSLTVTPPRNPEGRERRLEIEAIAEANARLIAAAPETAAERNRLKTINAELLTALKACQMAIRDYRLQLQDRIRLPNDTINQASYALKIGNDAIARAEGR